VLLYAKPFSLVRLDCFGGRCALTPPNMATPNGNAQEAFAPVLQAVNSMRDGHREQKKAAHKYLETFQKSVCQS
jgi:hypothetical protein